MKKLLIVDGYNVLNANREFANSNELAHARDNLRDKLADYAGFSGQEIILVFDAWLADRMLRSEETYGPVTVVYTRKGETADHYIERMCDSLSNDIDYRRVEVRVATSDNLEQTIVLGRGATRISSRELLLEMRMARQGGEKHISATGTRKNFIGDRLPKDVLQKLDELRKNPNGGT